MKILVNQHKMQILFSVRNYIAEIHKNTKQNDRKDKQLLQKYSLYIIEIIT